MQADIKRLISLDTDLATQVEIIQKLNARQFDPDALYALAVELLKHANLMPALPSNTVDIVGTGGDGYDTLNFSTMSALMANRCGIPVAKHGNKSSTSKCGSFDLLMQMGVTIPETPEAAYREFQQNQLVFLFAPYYHPILKQVAAARKVFAERGERTIFNLMGPLLNPARVECMSVGVYSEALVEPFAIVLQRLGVESAIVAYGDGLDELTVCGPSAVAMIKGDKIEYDTITPESFGFERASIEDLVGGDATQNFKETQLILSGQLPGPKTDMVVLNTAAAMVVSRRFDVSLPEAIEELGKVT